MRERPYGVGLGYRPPVHREILRHAAEIDFLEIPTEDWVTRSRRLLVDRDGRRLRELLERFPACFHGTRLSIGSVEETASSVDDLARFLDEAGDDAIYSDHLCFHRADGVDVETFLCMPFEEASVRAIAARHAELGRRLGRPIVLENVSTFYPVKGAYSEARFLARVLETTGTTLLLDVANVFNNAANHGYDPVQFIRSLPGDRVSQIHIATGSCEEGFWHDSHDRPVSEEVFRLLDVALDHTSADVVILERDADFWPFERLLDDLRRARAIFRARRPASRDEFAPAQPRAPLPLSPDPRELEQLRAFQRATVSAIETPGEAARARGERLGLDEAWAAKLESCAGTRLDQLHEKFCAAEEDRERERREVERLEWAAWARKGKR